MAGLDSRLFRDFLWNANLILQSHFGMDWQSMISKPWAWIMTKTTPTEDQWNIWSGRRIALWNSHFACNRYVKWVTDFICEMFKSKSRHARINNDET